MYHHPTRFFVLLCMVAALSCACSARIADKSEVSATLASDNGYMPEESAAKADIPIPEWKTIYFQLMKDTLGGNGESRGIGVGYGIELYDYDDDGIPELQEKYTSASQPEYHYIWFIENGEAKCLHTKEPEKTAYGKFNGLYANNTTGNLLLYRMYAHAYWMTEEYYIPTDTKEIWSFDSKLAMNAPYAGALPKEYSFADADGIECPISEENYMQHLNEFQNKYTQIKGEYLILENFFPWDGDAARIISDYFDKYDGIFSNVAEAAK